MEELWAGFLLGVKTYPWNWLRRAWPGITRNTPQTLDSHKQSFKPVLEVTGYGYYQIQFHRGNIGFHQLLSYYR